MVNHSALGDRQIDKTSIFGYPSVFSALMKRQESLAFPVPMT